MNVNPTFFPTSADFRKWLEGNHETARELWVGFYRKSSGKPSITWPESVDVALCYGWIDGIRKTIDEISYKIRFTPRKPNSRWSAINVKKVKELQKLGLMRPAGLQLFNQRKERTGYSYEQRAEIQLDPKYLKQFQSAKKAWQFFQKQPPSYRRLLIFYVMSAKQEETRVRRLARLIDASAANKRL